MNKKSIIIFLFIVNLGIIFAGGFTDIKTFDHSSVKEINISLQYENLSISNTDKSEILIITETNNRTLEPKIALENNSLTIANQTKTIADDFFCYVSILLPNDFYLDSVEINNYTGNVDIKEIHAKKIKVQTEGKSTFSNISTDCFTLTDLGESDIIISNLDCDSFDIARFVGKTQLSLKHPPLEESNIRTKSGEIEIMLSEDANYTVFAKSFNSKLINKPENTEISYIREGKKYVHNKGSATINIQTHSGDIIIR